MEEKTKPEFQISLASARTNAKLTQEEVAAKLHVSKQTVVNWENGKTKIDAVSFDYLCCLYRIPKDYISLPYQ